MGGYLLTGFIFPVLWLIFSSVSAHAHRVNIFAWVEGDTVYTESKFGGGKKVKNSVVIVYDTEGNQLLTGKTDEKGRFSFKIPKMTGLKVALKASMGHGAEWTIPAEEINPPAHLSEKNSPESTEKAADEPVPSTAIKTAEKLSDSVGVHQKQPELENLIDDALDRKLAPIVQILIDLRDKPPGLSEVIGGIGYIVGLVGVALYFANRRKKK